MKKVAILQSNYIPWKGYFDIIASVDEFILYDDVQYTKNDWRNRNRIKTPKGVEWLSVPAGQNIRRRIRDVELKSNHWQKKHWKTLSQYYCQASHFQEIVEIFEPLYLQRQYTHLSSLNRLFIETVCNYIGITTKISNSWDYLLAYGKTERLVELCAQANGTEYISGPSAKGYIDEHLFLERGIKLTWFDYTGYPVYPQFYPPFEHGVSILDLLFHTGNEAPWYVWRWRKESANDSK